MMKLYGFVSFGRYFFRVIFTVSIKLIGIIIAVIEYFLFHQAVHGCIGLYSYRIHYLPPARYHSFINALLQHLPEKFFEHFVAIQLSCSA